ncbi:VanZ family protein [Herbiconiux sp. P15]|uniref:VanZ family protein n=1 Tax=Herbiconiux liukaitaii TaxID=3342799 RepID=UPI0035BA675A
MLLVVYSVAVLVVVAWPTPVDRGASRAIVRVLQALHDRDVLMFIGYRQVEFLSNVGMFVPLGLLIGIVLGRRFWGFAVLIGFGLSVGIEVCQAVFLPERFATVDDVIANTSGALVGALVAGVFFLRRAVVSMTPPAAARDPRI